RCPTAHAEASEPARPETSDQQGGNSAGSPDGEAPRARDAKPVSRPHSPRQTGNATPPIPAGAETANRRMRGPPDDHADAGSYSPNRGSGTLRMSRTPWIFVTAVPV